MSGWGSGVPESTPRRKAGAATDLAQHDPVNHPRHYTSHPSGVEVIDYTRLLPFGPGNAVKYVMRRGLKGDAVEDIDKAIWYLTDSIEHHVTYALTGLMSNVIERVVKDETNPLVARFLREMYEPSGLGRQRGRSGTLSLEVARDVLMLLRDEEAAQ